MTYICAKKGSQSVYSRCAHTQICTQTLGNNCFNSIFCIIHLYCSSTSGFECQFAHISDAYSQMVPYDIHSIMHYGSHYFSANGKPTLLLYSSPHNQDTAKLVKMNMTSVPSKYDYLHVNLLYCKGKQTVFHITKCKNIMKHTYEMFLKLIFGVASVSGLYRISSNTSHPRIEAALE